jgi:hypothetical protein
MKRGIYVFIISAFVLIGCTSFSGVKPLYPKVGGDPNYPPTTVESLQPTFRWEPLPESDVTYDFIIYEAVIEDTVLKPKRGVGREIYYREGLKETEHKIEEPLKPGAYYYWSVRKRKGQNVSNWSVYDYTFHWGAGYVKAKNQPFIFRAPK